MNGQFIDCMIGPGQNGILTNTYCHSSIAPIHLVNLVKGIFMIESMDAEAHISFSSNSAQKKFFHIHFVLITSTCKVRSIHN